MTNIYKLLYICNTEKIFTPHRMTLRKRTYTLLGSLLMLAAGWSCSIHNYIPEGSFVLIQNIVETDRTIPRNERIESSEITKYIKQRPSLDIGGIRAWIYFQADSTGPKWWNKLLRNVGAEPVLLDTTLTHISANNIEAYIASRGYFDAYEEYSIRLNRKRQTASATYTTYQGEPYRVAKMEGQFADKFMAKVLAKDTAMLVDKGSVLDLERLGAERTRVAELLRNNGYYNFSESNIDFKVDTTIGNHMADVTMVVDRPTSGFDSQGRPIGQNFPLYRIGTIKVFPSYDATEAATNADYFLSLDTMRYHGLEILYSGEKPNLRPSVLRKLVKLQQGALYGSDRVSATYDNLMGMDYIRSANILFTPNTNIPLSPITYIGDHWSDTAETNEGVLDCEIRLAPAQKQSYNVELEASTTSSFYGVSTTVGYQNRNIFRGAELFDMNFTFGYELLRVEDPTLNRNSIELGGQVGITFPQFLFPVDLDPTGRVQGAKTRLEFSISDQNRRYYDRVLSNVSFGYTWSAGALHHYSLRPFDVSLVKMNHVSQSFLDRLQNPYLRDSYTTQMIAGLSGSYHYGEQNITAKRDYTDLRVNVGTSGNVISGIKSLLRSSKTDGHYTMFGIPYAQYIRTDVSWAQSVSVGEASNFVYRLYGGIIYPYGNSHHESLPADRLFYVGGINSMRGWSVRTLGPGSSSKVNSGYPSQFGNLRLEVNAELRFPIWGVFDGAIFADAGNVWYTPDIHGVPEGAAFRFGTFLPQVALDAGLGLRLNLSVLLLRFDWGVQLHDPNRPEGERWVIARPKRSNTTFNFGIGYPF